jgi:predicted O-linked N-acetylglucosamine transferase (SPINDLY family)
MKTNMTWHPEVKQYLSENNYQEIVNFYEQLLEENSENLTDYLYLGLAYLLAEKEEEAQTTWFLVIAEDEVLQDKLIEILATEAFRLEESAQKISVWLIRNYWREIEPENINNLLKLIQLEMELSYYHPIKLDEWRITEILKKQEKNSFTEDYLMELLEQILEFENERSVEFAEACLNLVDLSEKIKHFFISKLNNFQSKLHPNYVADLAKMYLDYDPDNEHFAYDTYWEYYYIAKLKECLDIAEKYREKSKDLVTKFLWNGHILFAQQMLGNWFDLEQTMEKHRDFLTEITKNKAKISQKYVGDALITMANSFHYFQDNPQENHYLQRAIAEVFQEYHNTNYDTLPIRNKDLNRKLKIGYLASTFKSHSVGWLARWLFQHHDRERFEIVGYCPRVKENPMTNYWFRDQCDKFYYLGNTLKTILDQIEEDKIDILVELDSFTYNLTGIVMAHKPAPIQVTWLGSDASSLPAIDYYIADRYVLPENAQEYYLEKIWRLPETYLGIDGFEIGIPSISKSSLGIADDAIIYFNVQNGLKVHPDNLKLQMEIVKAVPNSYFMRKAAGDRQIIEKYTFEMADQVGLAHDRIIIIDRAKDEATHRANLQVVDVVLDTYPYNGATTTLETLWVGTPMVTKVGEQFSARNSYAFMMNAGITEGIAWNDQEYFDWGVRLGQDANLRKEISWKLKQSRQTSPLWNAKKFTREMEKAYRQMWEIYCQK